MKILTLAPAVLGLWILLNPLLGSATWDDIVLGAIIVIVSIVAMFKMKE
ncbi:hypothetical protein ACFLUQ_01400 [Chloroflexota bacterium]